MTKKLLISVTPAEVRGALVDNGKVREVIIERSLQKSVVGNVYLGRIIRAAHEINAAFVDIGIGRGGLLVHDEDRKTGASSGHEGEAVLVQVVRDATGHKGTQLSTRITLPGRYLVYAPSLNQVKLSRRIEDVEERQRLREILQEISRPGEGYIVRTASAGVSSEDLAEDADSLRAIWDRIETRRAIAEPPECIHADLDPVSRILRDQRLRDLDRILVDDRTATRVVSEFCGAVAPEVATRIRYHSGPDDMFECHGINEEIELACSPRVDLPSGGNLMIEATEALTSIDVNSGRAGSGSEPEDVYFRINSEAAVEVVRQIRLRNLSGLIVIDFIRMVDDQRQEALLEILRKEVTEDRSRPNVLGSTRGGLVEITRRRARESLPEIMTSRCGPCDGYGRSMGIDTVCLGILRALRREARVSPPGKLVLNAASEVANELHGPYVGFFDDLRTETGREVEVRRDASYAREEYDIHAAEIER